MITEVPSRRGRRVALAMTFGLALVGVLALSAGGDASPSKLCMSCKVKSIFQAEHRDSMVRVLCDCPRKTQQRMRRQAPPAADVPQSCGSCMALARCQPGPAFALSGPGAERSQPILPGASADLRMLAVAGGRRMARAVLPPFVAPAVFTNCRPASLILAARLICDLSGTSNFSGRLILAPRPACAGGSDALLQPD